MTTTDTLPAVASNFYTVCKKCEVDRYHKVLAHTGPSSAKLQCEVCGAKSTYKLAKAKPAKKTSTGKVRQTSAVKKNQHNEEYAGLRDRYASSPKQAYNMRMKFNLDQVLEHPKFGVGFVRTAQVDKIEVVFEDEVRLLIHNRQ